MNQIKNQELITIIVPVYNIEKYLTRCVLSILKQSYRTLEIILIDDGSTDKSSKLCDELEKKDERIKVIHKMNEGLSSVRNLGVKEAHGKYIAHIDGDDFISEKYIEYLYNLMMHYKADISICNYIKFTDLKELNILKIKNKEKIIEMDSKKALEALLYQKYFTTSTWGKLFKSELLKQIEFPEDMYAQDMSTTYRLINDSNKIVYGSQKLYYYYQRSDSIVHLQISKREIDYIKASEEMVDFILAEHCDLVKAAYSRCFSSCIQILMTLPLDQNIYEEHKKIYEIIKKYRKIILFDSKARIKNRICAMISYIGINFLRKLLNTFK